MKWLEYRELTKRTLPKVGNKLNDSIHMVLGISSEVGETLDAIDNKDRVNIGEELADKCWYASNYMNIHNIETTFSLVDMKYNVSMWDKIVNNLYKLITFNWTLKYPLLFNKNYRELLVSISSLIDFDKKEFAYKKKVEKGRREDEINNFLLLMNLLFFYAGLSVEKSMENNINKLKVRFPDKFDEHLAKNRNLVAERVELEK